jgi:hypothetical protein
MASRTGARNPLTTHERAVAEIGAEIGDKGRTIPEHAEILGIAAGTLYRFLHDPDYEPRDNAIRFKLGLDPIVEVLGEWCHAGCGRSFPKRKGRKWCGKACSSREYRRKRSTT